MESLLNLPLWVNKSGVITRDVFFSDPSITPHAGVNVVFLFSDTATWIRYESGGVAYPLYLPEGIEKPFAVRSGELSTVRILSDAVTGGVDWQGNPLPIPNVPAAIIHWYGN